MGNVRCVILAAGAGTRLKSDMPKALHPLGGVTMLEHILNTVKSLGIKSVAVVTGHGQSLVSKALEGYDVKAIIQKRLLGSAHALGCARQYLSGFKGAILTLYVDTPLIKKSTLKRLLATHKKKHAACTLISARLKDPTGYGRIIFDSQNRVSDILEETEVTQKQKSLNRVNVGAYCFNSDGLFKLLKDVRMNKRKKEYYLTDIVKIFKEKGLGINAVDCDEDEALGINKRADLSKAESILRKRKIEELLKNGVTIVDPPTAYIDQRAEIGKDTIIYPSVVLIGDVRIGKGCRIGPFTKIRGKTIIQDGAIIGNFVEIVRSRIGKGTRIKHHAYIGDATIGKKVNIGAGAITANYDGRVKHKTTIGDGAFIGVGAVLIAPLKIGENALVGAGSVVCKNRNVKANTVVVGVPAKVLGKRE